MKKSVTKDNNLNIDKSVFDDNTITKDKLVNSSDTITKDNTITKSGIANDSSDSKSSRREVKKIRADKNNELIPFAWRFPLSADVSAKQTKTYKNIVDSQASRTALVPIDDSK